MSNSQPVNPPDAAEKKQRNPFVTIPLGLLIGGAVGAGVGMLLKELTLGVAYGLSIGATIGITMGFNLSYRAHPGDEEDKDSNA